MQIMIPYRLRRRTPPLFRCFIIGLSVAIVAGHAMASNTVRRVDAATGIETWETRGSGVSLRLTQILPDQVRAFYLGRGFDPVTVERIATGACVFQSVFRNESVATGIRFDLEEWDVLYRGRERKLRVDADWQREWETRRIPAGPRTAFRFALLPTRHEYAVGDWNMGMTLYPLALGSEFDLRFVWWEGSERHEARLNGVRCATDSIPAGGR